MTETTPPTGNEDKTTPSTIDGKDEPMTDEKASGVATANGQDHTNEKEQAFSAKPGKAKPEKGVKATSGKGRWLQLVVLVVVLVVILLLAWQGWQKWQLLQGEQQETAQQLKSLQRQQLAQKHAVQESRQSVNSQLSTLQDQVRLQGHTIATFGQGGQTRWLLNEAKSLASLASQRLLLTADLPATLKLLQASDKTLSHIDDPDVLPARRALAADMQKVRSAQQVDTTAMLLRLGGMIAQLDHLALPAVSAVTASANGKISASVQGRGWWEHFLAQLPIEVRHYNEDLPLPLKPAQLAQIRLSLSLDFQQAQLALLQGKVDVYQQVLKQAKQTLDTYFSDTQPQIESLDASIADMSAKPVDQALPDIGAGLEAIKALLQPASGTQKGAGGSR